MERLLFEGLLIKSFWRACFWRACFKSAFRETAFGEPDIGELSESLLSETLLSKRACKNLSRISQQRSAWFHRLFLQLSIWGIWSSSTLCKLRHPASSLRCIGTSAITVKDYWYQYLRNCKRAEGFCCVHRSQPIPGKQTKHWKFYDHKYQV